MLSKTMAYIARWRMALLMIMVITMFTGCDKSNKNEFITSADSRFFPDGPSMLVREPASCSALDQKKFVHEIMSDSYLWYDTVPQSVRYNDFDSLEELLGFLRYDPKDRFSYIVSTQEHDDYFNKGQTVGLGASLQFTDLGLFMVQYVYPDSPAADIGLERGDQILKINGKTINEITAQYEWDTIFGPDRLGIEVALDIKKQDGTEQNLVLAKAGFDVHSVFQSQIIEHQGIKVGYLLFNAFIEPSFAELARMFAEFHDQGVDEVVLDLRYNPGGMVAVAAALGGYLYGANTGIETFALGTHNNRYTVLDWSVPFEHHATDLELSRVVVLTSRESCSASELIINSLRVYMNVVVVGDTTCGKPVGMYGYNFCDQYFAPIEFEVKNARQKGGYFDGIPPNCRVKEDLALPLGDPEEKLLGEALHYISNNTCSSQVRAASAAIPTPETELPVILKGFRRQVGVF